MGLFSFITHDTEKSIPVKGSNRETFEVYMMDNHGRSWKESAYAGYGEFGGKDIYELVAEMNEGSVIHGLMPKREKREIGIAIDNGLNGIMNITTGLTFWSFGVDFFNWETDIVAHRQSANQLLENSPEEWKMVTIKPSTCKMPMLTQVPHQEWEFRELKSCPHQGFFYPDNKELWDQIYGTRGH